MRRLPGLLLLLVFLVDGSAARAQCCTSGSPFISDAEQPALEYRAKSTREDNEIIDASGYEVVFLTPQITYAFRHNWYLSAYSDIPLYKYYNGVQMSFGYAVSARITKKIDFIALKARNQARKAVR